MKNKIIKTTLKLKKIINSFEIVQEYFSLKNLIENDESLAKLRQQITMYHLAKDTLNYKIKKNEYDSHPLVNNFYFLKDEIKDFLMEIREQIDE